jgi:hypothetical protein
VCFIGAAVYVEHALRNPEGITYYPNIAFVVRPAIGPLAIAAFVGFEHLLIASGIWSLSNVMNKMAPGGGTIAAALAERVADIVKRV